MMIARTPYSLSAESTKAILDAARPAAQPSAEKIEATRHWLDARIKRAIKRARAEPIMKSDVTKLQNAYLRFQSAIRGLQDRDDPPPQIPVSSDGTTAWDEWIDGFRVIPFERGPKEGRDWQLIGSLLALYEVTSENEASPTANGPTMRFLRAASAEILTAMPAKKRSLFAPPTLDSLRHQLPMLRKTEILPASKKLTKIFVHADRE